jgi:hypothetical protein
MLKRNWGRTRQMEWLKTLQRILPGFGNQGNGHQVIKNKFTPGQTISQGSMFRPTVGMSPTSYSPMLRPEVKKPFVPDVNIVNNIKKNKGMLQNVHKTFGNEGPRAIATLIAENQQLNPNAVQAGGGPARGLWQFEPATWKDMGGGHPDLRYDPNVSTQMAKKLRDKRGWGQWSVNNTSYPGETAKKYERYLPYADYLNK